MEFIEGMPTDKGFSADLFLIANMDIFQEVIPDPQHLLAIESVKRGEPFYTAILFANAASKNGKPDMVYTITILKPDGTVYSSAKDIAGWKNRPPAVPGLVHLAAGSLKIIIDPEDPSGTYKVMAEIHDNARGATVRSSRTFTVK